VLIHSDTCMLIDAISARQRTSLGWKCSTDKLIPLKLTHYMKWYLQRWFEILTTLSSWRPWWEHTRGPNCDHIHGCIEVQRPAIDHEEPPRVENPIWSTGS
jgi:hypothetical protein